MSSIICDMNCDQETNKSIIEEHCLDCLCTGELANGDHGFVPAKKAWRPNNVVEERGRFNTLSESCFLCVYERSSSVIVCSCKVNNIPFASILKLSRRGC